MPDPWLSIIIPVRGEPANLWFTLQSLEFENLAGVEILVVDNDPGASWEKGTCCEVARNFGGAVRYMVGNAVQSPYYPRNVGADAAKGEWLLFLDSHVLLDHGFIASIKQRVRGMNAVNPSGAVDCVYPKRAMVHFPVAFKDHRTFFTHYRMTLEKNFWGEWGPTLRYPIDKPYPIAASGIWAFLTRRADFKEVGMFNENFRGYGGGEVYIHLKYWRMGGQVLMDPWLKGVHWSAPRAYTSSWDDRIRNVGIAGQAVVGPDFIERFGRGLQAYYTSKGVSLSKVNQLLVDGGMLGADEHISLSGHSKFTFDEVLELWNRENVLTS